MDRRNPQRSLLITASVLVVSTLWMALAQAQDVAAGSIEVLTYLKPNRSIEMSATESGVIGSVDVVEGDEVKVGQAMIHLDAESIKVRLEVAKSDASNTGEVLGAEAEYKLNQSRFEIVKGLKEKGTANAAEYERMETDMKISEGSLIAAKARLKTAQLLVKQIEAELERRILRSPIKGTVVEITKDVGESVSSTEDGQEYIIRVVDLDRLKAQAHIPFLYAAHLKESDNLSVRLEDEQKTLTKGKIEFISPVVDPATGTVAVHLVFENQGRKLTSGVPAMVLLERPAQG